MIRAKRRKDVYTETLLSKKWAEQTPHAYGPGKNRGQIGCFQDVLSSSKTSTSFTHKFKRDGEEEAPAESFWDILEDRITAIARWSAGLGASFLWAVSVINQIKDAGRKAQQRIINRGHDSESQFARIESSSTSKLMHSSGIAPKGMLPNCVRFGSPAHETTQHNLKPNTLSSMIASKSSDGNIFSDYYLCTTIKSLHKLCLLSC